MPYPKDHKARTRAAILDSAQRLFAARGFAATSIDDVMEECGLTRGGFYAHFRSKAELYREAMRAGFRPLAGPRVAGSFGGGMTPLHAPWASAYAVESALHAPFQDGSPLAFLAADIGAREPEVRAAYTDAVRNLIAALAREAPAAHPGQAATAAAAMLIGALAVAATTDDAAFRAEVMQACRTQAQAFMQQEAAEEDDSVFWTGRLHNVGRLQDALPLRH